MADSANPYYGLPLETLRGLQKDFLEALKTVVTVGKSYTVGQRSYTLSSLDEIKEQLVYLNNAIARAQGRRHRQVTGNFRHRGGGMCGF